MYSSSGSSTPAEACEKARVVADRSPDWNYTSATPKMNGLDNSYCSVVYVSRRDPSVVNTCDDCASWKLFRKGDQCANADDTYNASTGICEPPPKECKEGELFPAKGPDSPVVTSGGRNYVGDGGAPTACYQSCEYGGNPSPASCYLVKGSTTTGFCNYILKGTGQSCGADSYTFSQTGDSLNPPDTPNTDPSDPNDPGCPPGWSWSGTTCVKTPTDPTDPTDPTTPGGDGDGGGDGNGGGNNNGGGTGNGGDGSGGGDGNGGGDGSGDGDGSGTGGDGNGTCDPAKENCSTGPEGPGGELKEPTPGTWDDAIATWEKKVEEAKKELKTKVKANVDQMKGAFDLNLAEGGGQLPCESMTIWGKSYSLCISDYAGQLSSLRVALLLMAALIAALILLKD
ncbi:attachment protein G3P [Pseudomonas aeruginosa BL02]|nr:attachment protein G3P [Pseudomonas aeruginosa C23]ERU76226.1 attachment protein G3P [Pseudomonas aeruginosa C20]ERW03044.1 attachment protein G3P [Pseudomonas aeruginosa BWHPSA024]ERW14932.1 attachment protein G3P [Pseudomonas aeruginosa BWHPSA023]ERW76360.1 attachment protein G3P [Pseudomonas aeruginosa BWHPSA005]ERY60576.1 attachment protein G3P [Pseudomonas aeruginosa BL02]EZN42223.1 attachment protein G3P [Pseudomonas aeruginosa BWH036]EZN63539.1 attachment protein G3P [Pseudomonas a